MFLGNLQRKYLRQEHDCANIRAGLSYLMMDPAHLIEAGRLNILLITKGKVGNFSVIALVLGLTGTI